MRPTLLHGSLCLLLLALLVPSTALAAGDATRALGADGTMFALVQGSYQDLFPEGGEDAGEHPVMALEVRRPQASPELIAVPATFGPGEEFSPMLVMEGSSNTVFLLWESWTGLTQSRFLVTSFDGETWSETIEITGAALSWKSAARISVTHDEFDCLIAACDPEAATVSRTIVHLIWQQDSERGPITIYAPLVLENGAYVGEHPQLVLNDLLPAAEGETVFSDARIEPRVRPGRTDDSVVVGFLDGASGRLASVEVRVLPGELSDLGSRVEDGIEEAGRGKDLSDQGDLESVIEHARHQLIDIGARMKPEVVSRLVVATENYLGEAANGGNAALEHVAGGARHQLIDIGARMTDPNLMEVTGEARHQLIDIGARNKSDLTGERRHDLQARPMTVVSLPELPATTTLDLFLAPSGKNLLLAWGDGEALRYRETTETGWSATFELTLSEHLRQAEAEAILEQRVRGR